MAKYQYLFLICIGIGLTSQPLVAGYSATSFEPFVQRYEGTIGGKKAISVVLIHWGNDELSGWYYAGKKKDRKELRGNFIQANRFELKEYSHGEYSGAFFGNFEGQRHINGLWIDPKGKKKQSFAMDALALATPDIGWTGIWAFTKGKDAGRLIVGNAGSGGFDFALVVIRNAQLSQVIGSAFGKEEEAVFEEPGFSGAPCRIRFRLTTEGILVAQLSSSALCGFGNETPVDGLFRARKSTHKTD